MRTNSIVWVVSILLIAIKCDKGLVEANGPKDPREYTWTKTTLGDGTYQILPRDIWASSAQDVYGVGHASPLFVGKIWHFNGTQWNDITTKYIESHNVAFPGKNIFAFSFEGVFGFGTNDVWIVGRRDTSEVSQAKKKGFIIRYNGQVWREIQVPNEAPLTCVFGTSSDNVWFGSLDGKIMNYNGVSWQVYSLPDTISVQFFTGTINSMVYADGFFHSNVTGEDTNYLLEWNGSNWRVAEASGITDKFRIPVAIGDGLYSARGSKITRRVTEGTWQQIFSNGDANLIRLQGASTSNIFAVGGPAESVWHYNGTNWHRFTQFSDPNIYYGNLWMSISSVFILGVDVSSLKAYVLSGS